MPNPINVLPGDDQEVKGLVEQAQAYLDEANDMLKGERSTKNADQFEVLMDKIEDVKFQISGRRAILAATQAMGEAEAAAAAAAPADTPNTKGAGPDMQLKAPYDMPDGEGGWVRQGEPLKGYKTLGQMLYSIGMLDRMKNAAPDPRLKSWEGEGGTGGRKDLTDASGATGGFLVESNLRTQLLSVAAERSIIRPRATVIRMTRRQVPIPVLDQTGTPSSGASAFYGGIVVRWLEADAPKQETQPNFRQANLVAKELSGYTELGNTLLDDAALSLEDFLASPLGFAGAMAHAEDYAFLQGDGNGQPVGILNADAAIPITRAAGSAIDFVDIVTMMSRALLGGDYTWIAHQTTIPQIFTLDDPAGNNLWMPHTAGVRGQRPGSPGTLMGYDLAFTEKVPALGTRGDLSLVDPAYYVIGDRQVVTIDTSQHYLFQTNQTAWRVIARVDGQPWLSAPITLADGTTTVSPFIILN